MKTTLRPADLAIAPVAGYLGTKAMEPVSMKLYEWESEAARRQEDEVRPGPPYRLAAEKFSRVLGVPLSEQRLDRAALAVHYALPTSWAPLYAVLRRRRGMRPITAGLATGAAMSLIADEIMTPKLGFSAANRAYPWQTHVRGFVAHLTFGVAVAAVTEAAWAALRAAPRR